MTSVQRSAASTKSRSTSPQGEKARQWAATHRRILDAARSSFEEGYHSTSMSGIAKRAGVTRTAIYMHFENKASLVAAVVRELPVFEDIEAVLEPPLGP